MMKTTTIAIAILACFVATSTLLVDARPQDMLNMIGSSMASLRRPISLPQALALVDSGGLKTCLSRVLCELSCDKDQFGPDGRRLFNSLNRFKDGAPGVEQEQIADYKEASKLGEESHGRCNPCFDKYSDCTTSTPDLIRFANRIKIA